MFNRWNYLAAFIAGIAIFAPMFAFGQSNCADREVVAAALESKYGERYFGGGMQNRNLIIEVWFSEEKGTWTVLQTRSNGQTCILASGTNWREIVDNTPEGEPL